MSEASGHRGCGGGAGLGLGRRAIAGPMAVMPWRTLTLTLTPHACASFAQENTKRKRGADADSNGVSEKAMKWVRERETPARALQPEALRP